MGTSGTLSLQTSEGTPSIDVASSRSGIIGASLAGSQGFTKTSAGTLYVQGANTYTGVTEISAGTIDILSTAGFGDTGVGNHTLLTGGRARIGWDGSTNEEFIMPQPTILFSTDFYHASDAALPHAAARARHRRGRSRQARVRRTCPHSARFPAGSTRARSPQVPARPPPPSHQP
jgi:autotransporter-associated beta strand protein